MKMKVRGERDGETAQRKLTHQIYLSLAIVEAFQSILFRME
jgi:hypothetical protein